MLETADLTGDGWSVIENSGSGDDSVSSHTREFRRETSKGTIERITNQVEVHDSVSTASDAYVEFGYEEEYAISPGTTESLSIGAESEWARGQRDPNQYTNHVRVRDVNVAGYVAWHQVNNQEEYTAVDKAEIEPLAETLQDKWR